MLNGPYAEIKEQLGGYYLIDAPDLDAAIAWAARCPGAQYGAIEVRPIWRDVNPCRARTLAAKAVAAKRRPADVLTPRRAQPNFGGA